MAVSCLYICTYVCLYVHFYSPEMKENATQHIDLDEHGVFQRLTELLGARFDIIGM